jgi:hypothetical protein
MRMTCSQGDEFILEAVTTRDTKSLIWGWVRMHDSRFHLSTIQPQHWSGRFLAGDK